MISLTNNGLHLNDTILWLDAKPTGQLNFVSSPNLFSDSNQGQVITTEESKKILEINRKKITGLICQYSRPFSIGHIKLELLPSGSVLGGALLYIENKNQKILYAPNIQLEKNSFVHHLKLKKADILILQANRPDPHKELPIKKKELDRLTDNLKNELNQNRFPTIYADPFGVSQEIIYRLSQDKIPIAIHSTIYKINKVYEHFGSKLGNYSLYSPKRTKNKVVVFPLRKGNFALPQKPKESPVILIQNQLEDHIHSSFFNENQKKYLISSSCEGKDLKSIINYVDPKAVYFYGPYAKEYIEYYKSLKSNVDYLHVFDQKPLF